MVDAGDLKSPDPIDRVGSSPTTRTTNGDPAINTAMVRLPMSAALLSAADETTSQPLGHHYRGLNPRLTRHEPEWTGDHTKLRVKMTGREAGRTTMDKAATTSPEDLENDGNRGSGVEQRAAPRLTLLIRAAKLVADQGEFVCVIRDVSDTGIKIRLFHKLPTSGALEIHMPGGTAYAVKPVWERGNEAGFEFKKPINVANLIVESGEYPKRGLRLGLFFPVTASTLTQTSEAIVENLSQQGARISCEAMFALDQTLRLDGGGLDRVRAKVRWRKDECYGVVFDDTFTLGEFARMAARLQAPALLA